VLVVAVVKGRLVEGGLGAVVIMSDQAGGGMETVEGMMQKMHLSAAERKGIKIAGGEAARLGQAPPQAVGKVLAERLVNPEGLA
jgi:hypothetical protein